MIITDPWFYIFAVPAVVCLGLSKGGFAGLGMVATPLLALIMPPLQAAAILLPLLLIQDALSAFVYRKQWDAWNLKVMLPGAVIGMGIAWLLVAHVSDGAIRLLVGVIALVFSANSWLRRNRPVEAPKRPSAALGWFWGGMSSFTSALIHVGAPPYFAFVLPQRLEKMVYVSTTVWFFAVVNWLKVVPYFALGQFSTNGLATSVVLIPLAVVANMLGIWLVRRINEKAFYKITYALVFILGAELTRQGIVDLFLR